MHATTENNATTTYYMVNFQINANRHITATDRLLRPPGTQEVGTEPRSENTRDACHGHKLVETAVQAVLHLCGAGAAVDEGILWREGDEQPCMHTQPLNSATDPYKQQQ